MKTIILLLISFNSFAQDTIQPPCDLNRQQTRLWYKAIEDANDLEEKRLQLLDDQHKRENNKELKSLRYGVKSARIENRQIRDQFKFQKDSLSKSYNLSMLQERKRSQEALKAERTEKRRIAADRDIQKREKKIAQTEANKKPSWNLVIGIIGGLLLLFLLIVYRMRKKS